MANLNNLFLIIVLFFVPMVLSSRKKGPDNVEPSVIFPNPPPKKSQQSTTPKPQSIQESNSLDEILLRTANLSSTSQVLAALGIVDDSIAGRLGGQDTFAAMCEPELRAVPVVSQSLSSGDPYFPRCVRLNRCGGCCGASSGMECVPTKISHKEIKLNRFRIRRSTVSSVPQIVNMEVHDECSCQCKVKEEDCDSKIHDHRACNCVCKNFREASACHEKAATKTWDPVTCKCKCKVRQHCSSLTEFSEETCSCEAV